MSLINRSGRGLLVGLLFSLALATAGVLSYATIHGFALVGSVYMLVLAVLSTGLALWQNRANSFMTSVIWKLAGGIALFTIVSSGWAITYQAAGEPLDVFIALNLMLGAGSALMLFAWVGALLNR